MESSFSGFHGEVKIDENTHIHYMIPEINPNNLQQKLRVYPFPPKEFVHRILSRVPAQMFIRCTDDENLKNDFQKKFIDSLKNE